MNHAKKLSSVVLLVTTFIVWGISASAQELEPGKTVELSFPKAELPPTLYTMWTGDEAPPAMEYRLPDDYTPNEKYPLLVYVPGYHGNAKGNLDNARKIAGDKGWIVASVPLFKKVLDRSEVGDGIIVSHEDYPNISKAYAVMLGKLFEQVPNIDREKSAMVGFSNGAITIAVLLSSHDEFVLSHFRNFCLVDHGMFHLTDLHKQRSRDCRYLILAGDMDDFGRDLKIREGELQRDSWKLLNVDLDFRIMKDTGHEFRDKHMQLVGKWVRQEPFEDELLK